MKDFIELLMKPFRKPSAEVIAQVSIEESKRNLLRWQADARYSQKMVEYYEDRIAVLRKQLSFGIEDFAEK